MVKDFILPENDPLPASRAERPGQIVVAEDAADRRGNVPGPVRIDQQAVAAVFHQLGAGPAATVDRGTSQRHRLQGGEGKGLGIRREDRQAGLTQGGQHAIPRHVTVELHSRVR